MTKQQQLPEAQTAAIVDTNILVVYVTGLVNTDLIGSTTRTKAYSPEDFVALDQILGSLQKIITFPNTITEVSNLLGNSDSHIRYSIFKKLYDLFQIFTEEYQASSTLLFCEDAFLLGVTDHVILESVNRGYLLISDDFSLSMKFQSRGGKVLNFNHIRDTYIADE